ncbi:MAG: hypothetical protein V4510_03575 [bacterium]
MADLLLLALAQALKAATPDWKPYASGTMGSSLEIRNHSGLEVRVVTSAGQIQGPWRWDGDDQLLGNAVAVAGDEAAPRILYAILQPLADQVRVAVGTTAAGGAESFQVFKTK